MKKVFSLIFSALIIFSLSAYSGVVSDEDNLLVVKTKWFNIIYPECCEQSAALLYENADRIYEEVTAQYELTPSFRMPVVITSGVDMVNAFFTGYPYNRIVMYDTSSQTGDEISIVFSEQFLSVFRHELTHAVTFNIKNGFWKFVTDVFGDGFIPGAFFVTSGMAEGAAVASESSYGEGRLNNEYARHFVKQAKIENSFPSYFDVQGASDSLINGVQYYFNGAFHKWLQDNYGMTKYADFWHSVINLDRAGVLLSFKKTYGISLRKAWDEFENSYVVPDVKSDYFGAYDFFNNVNIKDEKDCSLYNKGGFRYSSLCSSDTGVVYIDEKSNKVLFVPDDELKEQIIKPKVLFYQDGLDNITFSRDGRFVAVSYYSDREANISSKIKIYDMENGCFFNVDDSGLKNGSVIYDGNDYYLVCHKYINSCNSILIYKVAFDDKNKIKSVDNIRSFQEKLNVFCFNFIDLGNGTFSYIKKDKLDFSICISDLYGNLIDCYNMPSGVVLHDMSEHNNKLYFSWAEKGTMPRLGYVSQDSKDCFLGNTDISGGVFNPVVIGDGGLEKLIYIGKYYKEDRIFSSHLDNSIVTDNRCVHCTDTPANYIKNNVSFDTDISLIAEDYKRLDNINFGLIIPFSIYSSEMFGENLGASSVSQYLPFGITYADSNPWSNGDDDLLLLSTGWSHLTNSAGFEIILNQKTGTDIFSYNIDLKTEIDRNGWKQSSGFISLSSAFLFGNISYFFWKNDFKIAGGKQNYINSKITELNLFTFWDADLFEISMPMNNSYNFYLSDLFYIGYSNVHRAGAGRFEKAGISFSTGIGYIYDSFAGKFFIVNSDFSAFIPYIIPVIPIDDFVYNLPAKINLSLFPPVSDYGLTGASFGSAGHSVLDTNIESVLFGFDIQKAVPFFEILFVKDLYITGGYKSTIASYKGTREGCQIPYIFEYFSNLSNGNSIYLDSFYLKLATDICANIGVMANSMLNINLYCELSYPLNVLNDNYKRLNFKFGVNGRF